MNSEPTEETDPAGLPPEAIARGLARLSPEEIARLDAMITPETAYLLAKAFGPAMGRLLWPLVEDDPVWRGVPTAR